MQKIMQNKTNKSKHTNKQINGTLLLDRWSLTSFFKQNYSFVIVFDWHIKEIIPMTRRSIHMTKIIILLISFLILDIYHKDIANLSQYFRHHWPCPPKLITSTCIQSNLYLTSFGYFGHASPHPSLILN